jgi:hypothetical protein
MIRVQLETLINSDAGFWMNCAGKLLRKLADIRDLCPQPLLLRGEADQYTSPWVDNHALLP